MSWLWAWAVELPGVMVYSDAVLKVLLALTLLGVLILSRPTRRLAAIVVAWNARQGLGALVGSLDRDLVGRLVVLRGQLVGRDACTERFEDQGPALAATVSLNWLRPPPPERRIAVTSTAQGLTLRVQGCAVHLDGPIEVLVGSTESLLRRPLDDAELASRLTELEPNVQNLLAGRAIVARSLTEGEEVHVQGVLRHRGATDQPEGYRRAAERWVLEGVPDAMCPDIGRAPLIAAFARRPRFRAGIAWLHAAAFLVGAGLVALSAKSGIYLTAW